MLTELRVRDLLVIGDVTLPLAPGLNVLTGETGAGKSLLVDALALLLGERASADLVRPGAARAVVEAAFDLPAGGMRDVLDAAGLEADDGRLVVRRDINAEGRNRAWVNGSPSTVAVLASLGRGLVDLHGQHEAQSLLTPAAQRDILDAFGAATEARALVRQSYASAAAALAEEEDLLRRRDDVRVRADYLRFVAQEITEAAPRAGEDEALAGEARRLANVEELTRLAHQLGTALDGDDGGALGLLGAASRAVQQLARLDPGIETRWNDLLDEAYAAADELARTVRGYAAALEADPERLGAVERRRDLLFRLLQKYGPTLDDVVEAGTQAAKELELLDTADVDLAGVRERRATAEAALRDAAADLSAIRRRGAEQLSRAVERLLPGLGMAGGKFIVDVQPAPAPTADGADHVAFLIKLNLGLDPRPLAQVASGGELSRLMLALKVVLARQDAVPTLVFDEVDQGIGGEVAVRVGEALAHVARSRQVLVVTHLPQIAARAAQHVRVAKRARGGLATADLEVLTGEARVEEIARMLGDAEDERLLQHAGDLLERSGKALRR